jgi:hypothetical protein
MKTRMVTVFVAILGILIPSIAFSKQQDMLIAFLQMAHGMSILHIRLVWIGGMMRVRVLQT